MRISRSHLDSALSDARSLSQESVGKSLPIDVRCIAQQLGVSRVESRSMNADGYLGRSADGSLVIRCRTGSSPERLRFTIAHEVAHIILARVQGVDLSDPEFRRSEDNNEEELAVNRIAGELLMPGPLFGSHLRSARPSWNVLQQLRGRFGVSTTAMLKRVLEMSSLTALFIRIDRSQHLVNSGTLSYRCHRSEAEPLSFLRPVQHDVWSILAEAEKKRNAVVPVYVRKREYALEMATRYMPFFKKQECWSIGWQILD
jgi:Zn-dependent peptidase ImmA (M78 family)